MAVIHRPYRRLISSFLLPVVIWQASAASAIAGMPTPYLIVTELGKRRLEEISFFLAGFLLLTAVCRWCWNSLTKEFPALPQISYRGALGMMFLWGLAMTVVLSLISGARELMTPAAWEPNGVTQRLVKSGTVDPVDEMKVRRERIETLKTALWQYAAQHDSHFPDQIAALSIEVTIADPATRLPFFLRPELTLASPRTLLASEPDIFPEKLQLLTDGSIESIKRTDERHP